MQVARSGGRSSYRDAKGGVCVDDANQFFCIRPALGPCGDEQRALTVLFQRAAEVSQTSTSITPAPLPLR